MKPKGGVLKNSLNSGRVGLSVLFCSVLFRRRLTHLWRASCFTPIDWNVDLIQKDPCRNTQNNVWPTIWAPHGPGKLTFTCYGEGQRDTTGLAGVMWPSLCPVQGRVFCWASPETLREGQALISQRGSGSCLQEKGEGILGSCKTATGSALWRVSLCYLLLWRLTSRHSSPLWLPLVAPLLCVKREQPANFCAFGPSPPAMGRGDYLRVDCELQALTFRGLCSWFSTQMLAHSQKSPYTVSAVRKILLPQEGLNLLCSVYFSSPFFAYKRSYIAVTSANLCSAYVELTWHPFFKILYIHWLESVIMYWFCLNKLLPYTRTLTW